MGWSPGEPVLVFLSVYILQIRANQGGLHLTPFIEQGHTGKARELSRVSLQEKSDLFPNKILDKIPESHSGYITVDKKLGNHLFFWHFKSPKDNAPLLVWLNGGPAISSMLGLLWEHGPLNVQRESKHPRLKKRRYSWVRSFSVVYVDNPVGTGYSYSESGTNGYKITKKDYTNDLHSFVKQFLVLFPEFYNRGIYIGGQSYAGKYVPALAYRIHETNNKDIHYYKVDRNITENQNIKLLGIILGAPYFDPETESVAFFDYLYAVGAISYSDMKRHKISVRNLYQKFLQGGTANSTFSELFSVLVLSEDLPLSSLDNYVTGQDADYDAVAYVMRRNETRQAVHAGDRKYFVSNDELSELYGPDVLVSTKPEMAVIMDNYKVLVYNGDYDVVVSSVMLEAALMSTAWSLQKEYNTTQRKYWEKRGLVQGFYSQTGKFCRVVIHGAGHQTPREQPEACFKMVNNFLQYGCIRSEN